MAQAAFAFDTVPLPSPVMPLAVCCATGADAALRTGSARGDTGFELGWDHARHSLVPPAEHLLPANPLRQGWEAGRAAFGRRALKPTRHVRQWLQLRLQAWRSGLAFEDVQVTPHYLAQIDSARCPVTRVALAQATGGDTDATVDRIYVDAGYAAGNLAAISLRARTARARAPQPN